MTRHQPPTAQHAIKGEPEYKLSDFVKSIFLEGCSTVLWLAIKKPR
ncbi:hypothetical protein MGWOODY_Clf401 [hydrothermal vent metagenome]|uniref:Uncharacterized protein n=1 Tax=hydrothermal vent metagenome TaxID=652676 RepID=A0A160V9S7_9ZZZZ